MTTPQPGSRAENIIQIAIVILIGGMAGAASFTHVHDWTMHNSPPGTGGWFGWANAIISELTPTAAGLEIRRRKRHHRPIAYPMTVLMAAAALSLTAQVAQATRTPAGWLAAAVPALAFLALTKLVLARTTATAPASLPTPSPAPPDSLPAPVPATTTGPASADLVTSARLAAVTHRQVTGHDITPGTLAAQLAIPGDLAARLIHALDDTADQAVNPPSPVTHLNGTPIGGSRP